MRTLIKIRDIEQSLFRLRVTRGQYLSDIPYESLASEVRQDLLREATMIHNHTHLELRLVVRKGRYVWRFLDRR